MTLPPEFLQKNSMPASDLRRRKEAWDLLRKILEGTENQYLLSEIGEDGPEPVLQGRDVVGGIIGDTEVLRGRTIEDKPLVRHKKTKRRYKGSGRYGPPADLELDIAGTGFPPTARQNVIALKELSAVERSSKNYRETASYREAFEALLPANADVTARGSLAWWFDQAWEAAEGSPQVIECPHPEVHQHGKVHGSKPLKHIVAFKKEANLIFKMIELAVGKAQQTTNININEKKLVESLEYRVIDVNLQSIDMQGVDSRIKMIAEMGYINSDASEIDASEIDGGFIDAEEDSRTHAEEEVPGEQVSA